MQEKKSYKTDEILNSLEGIQKAAPHPYFFTRLEARMRQEKNPWYILTSFLTRPAIALAAICLILVLNGFAIVRYFDQQQDVPPTAVIQNVDDNFLISGNLVDLENFAP